MAQYTLPIPLIGSIESLNEINLTKPPSFAVNDLLATADFLKQYDGNQATFDAYR